MNKREKIIQAIANVFAKKPAAKRRDPENMSRFERTVEEAEGVAAHFSELFRNAVLAIFFGSLLMWILNFVYAPVNMLFGIVFVGMLLKLFTKPKVLLYVLPLEGFFAFLRDEDVSQGLAAGPEKLSKLGLFAIYTLSLNAIILATWSFWNNGFGAAMSYWGFWLVTIAIGSLSAVMGGGRFGSFAKRLQMGYLILVALSLVWNTINLGYALPEEVSDENGKAVVMYNPQTGQIVDDLSPADCRKKSCFAADGIDVKLVPLPKEEAERRNPKAWVGKALNASESPMFWPLLIIVAMGAGYGFYRTRSAWGVAPAIGIGLLCVSLYPLWDGDTPSFATEAKGELFAASAVTASDCESVAVGAKVTLSKAANPCLDGMSTRLMLIPAEERYWPAVWNGDVIDWSSGADAPKLKAGEFPDTMTFAVAATADTDASDRNKIRADAGIEAPKKLAMDF